MAFVTGGAIGSCKMDNLIAGTYPPAVAKLFDLLSSSTGIKRGTVLGRTSAGKYYVLGDSSGATGRIPFPWNISAGKATSDNATISTNNGKATVKLVGNTINVAVDVSELSASDSGNAEQGTHKWLALDVGTGLETIIGVKYNGVALTATDVTEAAGVGLGAGHFVLWLKADEVVSAEKTFTLEAEGYPEAEIKVKIVEALPSAITGTASAIVATDVEAGDIVVEAYVSGNFYRNMVTVAEGYALTEEDENNLRLAGILLTDGI